MMKIKRKDKMRKLPICLVKKFDYVFTTIRNKANWKFNLPRSTCEDISASAVVYALAPFINGNGEAPKTEKDFFCLAWTKAKLLALDEIRRLTRCPITESIDILVRIKDGNTNLEHPAIGQASYDRYRSQQLESDHRAKARLAMALLPRIFAQAKISARDQVIYRAVELDNVPTEKMAAVFELTPNNINQICYRVRQKLAAVGPDIVNQAFAA